MRSHRTRYESEYNRARARFTSRLREALLELDAMKKAIASETEYQSILRSRMPRILDKYRDQITEITLAFEEF